MVSFAFGLLIARLFVGLGFAAHGAQKLFGWFEGPGIAGTAGYFASLGFRPGVVFAVISGIAELLGGLLIGLGLGGPFGPAMVLGNLLVAAVVVHMKNGFFESKNGWEMPALYIAAATTFAFVGFGSFSLDAKLKFSAILNDPVIVWCALGIGVSLATGSLLLRQPERRSKRSPD
ncbi:MAG: DoxX family protein [Candidatus Eremiobacteraeota bacterium]|nr:DoxX family protein [Candidatus Eremiobacteraeota bacterium]